MLKRKIKECDPSVTNQTILMARNGLFITREVFKNNCASDCPMKQACGIVLSYLEMNRWKDAIEVLKNAKARH